ncbi:hypothetical protein [Massilia sp. Root1485]|uniref:hypothetical protein n=1 Tax=Massilia sp. Root1485 TaxID=1736472 RepID=UPI000AEC4D4B|nr:hypothetical protein [Massilia sp. Root1485]
MKLVMACAALLLGVGVSIIYKDRITADNVGFARDCVSRGGKVRMEYGMRQCVGASREEGKL